MPAINIDQAGIRIHKYTPSETRPAARRRGAFFLPKPSYHPRAPHRNINFSDIRIFRIFFDISGFYRYFR
jgi:hypothetical protein